MPGFGAFLTAIGGAAVAAAPVAGAAAGVYSVVEGRRQAKKAESAAEEYAQREYEMQERQAGEYFDLTKEQMRLQTQAKDIVLLSDIFKSQQQKQEPEPQPATQQVLTLPAATTYTPAQQINMAIDRMFRV